MAIARWRNLILGISVLGCGSDVAAPKVATSPTVTSALALGTQFTCALTADAKPYCWGSNLAGQIGDSTFLQHLTPSPGGGGHAYVAVSAAANTACAIDTHAGVWCWGDDPTQPGVRSSFRLIPIAVATPAAVTAISAGSKFACALDANGNAYCWGENGRGQLGVGDTLPHASPTAVSGGLHFASITTGFWSACGLTSAGSAYCWGDNQYGELGTNDTASSSKPRQVFGPSTFRSLGTGSLHSCGITTAGATLCWGGNFSGQLGDGSSTQHLVPTPAALGLTFTAIRASRANSVFSSTCGITTGGDVYCWGWNSKGQLSNVTSTDTCDPTRPAGTTNPLSVTTVCSYRAQKVIGVSNAVSIDVGEEHACALTAAAQIFCWGDNAHGELGDGTGVAQATPVLVKGGLSFP